MNEGIERHYGGAGGLAEVIAARFRAAGRDPATLTTADLGAIDEFHVRGRGATLELARCLEVGAGSRVLDVGSGLGGPARTLAETLGCDVLGIDLTAAYCEAATTLSRWVGLSDRVRFVQGDATVLDLPAGSVDAAMTIHAAMNIADKPAVYAGVHRALKTGRVFAVYDVLQGEGGAVHFPVPWARDAAISHLATPAEMRRLLQEQGFAIDGEFDSTEESEAWFRQKAARIDSSTPPPIGIHLLLGDDYAQMARNQVRNLVERRIRTVMFVARRR